MHHEHELSQMIDYETPKNINSQAEINFLNFQLSI